MNSLLLCHLSPVSKVLRNSYIIQCIYLHFSGKREHSDIVYFILVTSKLENFYFGCSFEDIYIYKYCVGRQ